MNNLIYAKKFTNLKIPIKNIVNGTVLRSNKCMVHYVLLI